MRQFLAFAFDAGEQFLVFSKVRVLVDVLSRLGLEPSNLLLQSLDDGVNRAGDCRVQIWFTEPVTFLAEVGFDGFEFEL